MNKPNPLKAKIAIGDDGKGTITLSDDKGENNLSGTVTYTVGNFTTSFGGKNEGTITMKGKPAYKEQGITVEGDLELL